jgi:hypothetical protein
MESTEQAAPAAAGLRPQQRLGLSLSGKEVRAMTGSSLVPFIVPVVAALALAAWLAMVFYAEAHPRWKTHSAAQAPRAVGAASRADAREQNERQEHTLVAADGDEAAEPGKPGRSASPPPRKAA